MNSINTRRLRKVEEYNEEMGCVIFVSFLRDDRGVIQSDPPDVYCGCGYLEPDFDEKKWTHFIDDDLNWLFTDADPVNFP